MEPIPRPRRRRFSTAARRFARGADGLHRCVACASTFVCPIEWETDGPDHWRLTLHCGECDVWRDVRATNAEAKTFDLELDRQIKEIEHALAELDRELMREQADVFLAALRSGLIEAADFAAS